VLRTRSPICREEIPNRKIREERRRPATDCTLALAGLKRRPSSSMKTKPVTYLLNVALLCAFVASTAFAQNRVAPVVLPKPEQAFSDAKIGRTYKDSKPGTISLSKAPAGAPNVLLILIDDSGFGQWGTFGGQVPTPNLDRLAKMGLRYTRFHTTALCSPSRAAIHGAQPPLRWNRRHHGDGRRLPGIQRSDSQECGDVC
jgi:hypothetical protein